MVLDTESLRPHDFADRQECGFRNPVSFCDLYVIVDNNREPVDHVAKLGRELEEW